MFWGRYGNIFFSDDFNDIYDNDDNDYDYFGYDENDDDYDGGETCCGQPCSA